MNLDYIVEGNVFVNGEFQQCCFGVNDGKIAVVKKILTGSKKYRFSKQFIVPAGIDCHVHFRDPGFAWKESFRTGSVAAAFGGVGCVFDMPNTRPQTVSKQTLVDKINQSQKQSVVDFGIYAGITDGNIGRINELSSFVPGFKVFLGESTHSLVFSEKNLPFLFSQLNHSSKPVLFHAESSRCLEQHKRVEKNLFDHHLARPSICEQQAVENILSHAPFSFPVHICHVSSFESFSMLHERGGDVSFGVTPHHSLLHIDQNIPVSSQAVYKVNPPLRPVMHQTRLFDAMKQGFVPLLESDHAPHTKDEKSVLFADAPSGIIGVETMYPLFLYLAVKQQIPFSRIVSMICENPGKLCDLSKGFIRETYDADFIVVDAKDPVRVSSDLLHSKNTLTPFEGCFGLFPSHVFIRGEPVVEEKALLAHRGFGNHVVSDAEVS